MSVNTWDYGDLVRCTGSFANSAGTAIDPVAVFFQMKSPSNQTTTYQYGVDAELVKDSAGNYHVDVNANEAGAWKYRFYSTGTGQAAGETSFNVGYTSFG